MTIVAFDYQAWARLFPEFTPAVTEPMANRFFATATLFIDNTDTSPISADPPNGRRGDILNFATAHIAKLLAGTNTDAPTTLVGRLSQAGEGTVNVATELGVSPDSPSRDWWVQTQYGFFVWQATAPYRTAIYVPAPPEFAGPPFPFASPFGRVF